MSANSVHNKPGSIPVTFRTEEPFPVPVKQATLWDRDQIYRHKREQLKFYFVLSHRTSGNRIVRYRHRLDDWLPPKEHRIQAFVMA